MACPIVISFDLCSLAFAFVSMVRRPPRDFGSGKVQVLRGFLAYRGGLIFSGARSQWLAMRRFFIVLAIWLLLAPSVRAGEGSVLKVLPQLLDERGRHALSPSLYERDAYQFHLRKEPKLRGGARLAVQWKAKNVDWSKLKLRAEMRCLLEDKLHSVTKEEPAVKNGHFSNWSEFRIEGADYKTFGQIVAWRVTLFEGDRQLGQLESFLWSGVVPDSKASTSPAPSPKPPPP
jgi:hypothetical protein